MKLTIVEKNILSWTAMHIDFVMCKNQNRWSFLGNSATWRNEVKQEEDQRNTSKRPSVIIQRIDVITHQSKDG